MRHTADSTDGANELDTNLLRRVDELEEHIFAGLNTAGVVNESVGKLSNTGICHWSNRDERVYSRGLRSLTGEVR